MILFADSGSTKTSWLLYDPAARTKNYEETLGINPVVQNLQEVQSIVQQGHELLKHRDSVTDIWFYGAGCSSNERRLIVETVLRQNFPRARVVVDHDVKAAGVAVCGDQPGIACILGTGSNSIAFDGVNWIDSKVGVGYVLGDEGSGAYMGKLMLRDFLYDLLPGEMKQHLVQEYVIDKNMILEHVYKKPSPNRFLAGFSPVLTVFRDSDYVQQLLHYSFSEFFKYGVATYPNYQDYPVGFVGSIARFFDKELIGVANEYGCRTGKFVQRPIDDIAEHFISRL